ncbi:hypothetical protein PUR32_23560, partial [Streptomyces sp. BE133]|nr:hypothetical protein [Streptomyces sp. BE133]
VVATVVRVVMTTVVGVLRVGSSGVMTGRVAPAVTTTAVVAGSVGTTIVVVAPGVVSVGTTGGMTVRVGSVVMTAGVVPVRSEVRRVGTVRDA